jgi:hypothetical protein
VFSGGALVALPSFIDVTMPCGLRHAPGFPQRLLVQFTP